MDKVKINEIIKNTSINIPIYIFRLYKTFNLTLEEFLVLMYLYNKNGELYDPEKISIDLNMDLMEIMEIISSIQDKGLITLDVSKSDGGIIEEKINIDKFYEKIAISLMDNLGKETHDENILELIEQEFNRKLSPMESEYVKSWQNENYSDELIKEALKEASLYGVNNLRYIDKILFDWNKKGFKTKQDVINNRHLEEKEEIEEISYNNYNWLDDDE